MKKIAILGSTGSIGTQTLDVVDKEGDLEVTALTAHSNIDLLEKQIRKYRPALAAVDQEDKAAELRLRIADTDTRVLGGPEGVAECAAASDAEMVVTAIVGIAGLDATLAAIEAGKDIALANKETLVTAGDIVMPLARERGVNILPVDSEHSAIFQSISDQKKFLKRIIITASGGPFFGMKREELAKKTRFDALKHPNWNMGAKITVDSATLVNKGLEIIEAKHLFGLDVDHITPVVHRESIIHSLVEFTDGSVIGQLGVPDMRLPIAYALTWPLRKGPVSQPLDLVRVGRLTFYEIDNSAFPAVELAKKAARIGGTMPAVLNGANEEAVAAFLRDGCGFLEITELIERAMENHRPVEDPTVDDIKAADAEARELVRANLNIAS